MPSPSYSEWSEEIQAIIKRHVECHHHGTRKAKAAGLTLGKRAKKNRQTFVKDFEEALRQSGGTVEAAELLFNAFRDWNAFCEGKTEEGTTYYLKVYRPFSQLIVKGWKSLEFRREDLISQALNQRVFIVEIEPDPAKKKFEISDTVKNHQFDKKTGTVVGSVIMRHSKELKKSDLTPELAEDICLTYESLKANFDRGYKFVYYLKYPCAFNLFVGKQFKSEGKTEADATAQILGGYHKHKQDKKGKRVPKSRWVVNWGKTTEEPKLGKKPSTLSFVHEVKSQMGAKAKHSQ